jgi:hypothetical protein
MSMVFPSGSNFCYQNKCGIYFWGIHSHDAIWHLALVETSFSKIPFINPVFSGVILTGYNYLYDLVLFALSKLGVPILFAFFKLIPFVWFIIFTYLLIKLAQKIYNNSLFVKLFLFFVFFTGSFSYYFTILHDKTIAGSYGTLSQLPMHFMLNFQFALSLLGILYILMKIKDNKSTFKDVVVFGIITFINMGLKFYGGVVTFILVICYLLLVIRKKTIKKTLINILMTCVFFTLAIFIFYNPFSAVKSGSIFSWAPLALVHPITEDPSLFYLQKLTDARYFLQTKGVGSKLIMIESINLILFLFFYLGVRFFGLIFLSYKALRQKLTKFDLIVIITMVVTTLFTLTLVQKAEWWNTIQFFYYAVFLSTIYITECVYQLIIKYKRIGWLIAILIVILAIPATLNITQWSFSYPGNAYLPLEELQVLNFLKKQPRGIVLAPLYQKELIKQNQYPAPLYAVGDTSYVTAFSGQQSYLADIVQLRLTGVNYEKRLTKIKNNDCSILDDIDYIYYNNDYKIDRKLFDCKDRLELIFGNRTASVFRVIKL